MSSSSAASSSSSAAAAAPAPVEAPPGHKIVTEGSASIIFGEQKEVFYNNVQVFNRDLSILVISMFAKQFLAEKKTRKRRLQPTWSDWGGAELTAAAAAVGDKNSPHADERTGLRVLEALSATGLRSIRYINEIPGIETIIANDLDEAAVEAIGKNLEFNQISPDKVKAHHSDATLLMYMSREKEQQFDVVDLDPYGSAAIFLDAAVQCVSDGGLLAVTCTDMAVLCGNHDGAYAKYGSFPLKGKFCHEQALRIVMSSIEHHANRYKRHVVPLLAVSVDFYVRLFVRVYDSPKEMKKSATKHSFVMTSPAAFHLQPVGILANEGAQGGGRPLPGRGPVVPQTCTESGSTFQIGGPIWNMSMVNRGFVEQALANVAPDSPYAPASQFGTRKRIEGVLTALLEEVNVPLYYDLPALCSTVHCNMPSHSVFQAALINAGYQVSQSHCNPDAVKTDAPPDVIWDIIRCWVKKNPINEKRKSKKGTAAKDKMVGQETVGNRILAKEPTLIADFTITPQMRKRSAQRGTSGVRRFPQNPEENWGPKARARGKRPQESDAKEGEAESKSKQQRTDSASPKDEPQTQELPLTQ